MEPPNDNPSELKLNRSQLEDALNVHQSAISHIAKVTDTHSSQIASLLSAVEVIAKHLDLAE